MAAKEIRLGYPQQPKEEVHSPPLSPRSSDDDDDATEPEDSEGEEEEGGARVGTGAAVVSGPPLKKGPWTPDEDRRLKTYVEAHGEGNWNQVQRNAGLNRCGKSCRLRWANHLRPHLKKGPFSEEEERMIIELHAKHGNKWAQMASKLPGRTDNEIKNFWNTRSKRFQKAGKDLYPEDLLSRMRNQDMDSHSPDDSQQPNELSQGHSLQFENIRFDKLDYKRRPENFLAPTFSIAHEPERTCYTDTNPGITKNYIVPFNNAIPNGLLNFSTPGTIQRPIKRELPSVQNIGFDSINSWPCHIPPATPADRTFISSPASVLMNSEGFPSQNNGMMVQQGQILGDGTNLQGEYEVLVPPAAYVCPLSPHSSVFDDNLLEGGSLDEFGTSKSPTSLDALLADSKYQVDDIFPDKYLSPLPDPCRTDARYVTEHSSHLEYQPINDQVGAYFGYPYDENFLSAPGDGQQQRLESVLWNSMPDARHVSES